MADKKITALTELNSTGKAGEDFLHIIDYGGGSSPVNKRISLTNLFSKVNLDTHIYGVSKTFEIGSTDSASSAFKVTTGSNTTLTTSIQNEVVVNDDQSRHIDFTVKSVQSAGAIKVISDYTAGNSGPGVVWINSDSGNQDFCVAGDGFVSTNPVLFSDASADALGIGTNVVDATYQCTIAAVSGKSIKSAGTIDITGSLTASASATIGLTAAGTLALSSVESVTTDGAGDDLSVAVTTSLVTTTSSSGAGALADGTTVGQIKCVALVVVTGGGSDYVLTPATMQGSATTITFNVVGDCATLMWQVGGWAVVGGFGIDIG